MSNMNVCQNCGCTELVSDRSLGGKLVCSRCGSSSFRSTSFSPIRNKKIIYFIIGFIVLLIIVI